MMLSLPAQSSALHPSVATAASLPTGEPAGWMRIVIDELALYISDGATYSLYPAVAPFAFAGKKAAPESDKKYEELSQKLEVTQKAVQGAYDLISSLPKPEPIVQREISYDDTHVKNSIESVSSELGFLMEAHEKQSEQIDEQVLNKVQVMQKDLDFLQSIINDHGTKLANIRQSVPNPVPQFNSILHFLLWLVTLGFFGANKPHKDEA